MWIAPRQFSCGCSTAGSMSDHNARTVTVNSVVMLHMQHGKRVKLDADDSPDVIGRLGINCERNGFDNG